MTPVIPTALVHAADLTPDEARTELRRELLRPEYRERDFLSRAFEWAMTEIDRALTTASDVPRLYYAATVVVGLVLVLALGVALSRFRRGTHEGASASPVSVLEEGMSAEQLRARARTALAAGRDKDAVVDAFRALATSQVERRRIENVPGATAHELAEALAQVFAENRREIVAAADLFDATLYGDQDVRHEQAAALLALETDLAGAR